MSIYSKLISIQNELKAPKNQYNSFGKYNYRNCEDILEALKPILKKYDCTLIIADDICNINDRFYVKAKAILFDCETGESVTSSAYAREEETKKGMDGSQVTGASSSYARKYCLNGLLLIDDTKDADSMDNSTSQAPKTTPKTTPKAKAQPAPQQQPQAQIENCMQCGKPIEAGGGMTSAQVAKARFDKYGMPLCGHCAKVMRDKKQANEQRIAEAFENMDVPFEIVEG